MTTSMELTQRKRQGHLQNDDLALRKLIQRTDWMKEEYDVYGNPNLARAVNRSLAKPIV